MHLSIDVDDTIAATAEQFCRRVATEYDVDLSPAELPAMDDLRNAAIPGTDATFATAIAAAITDPAFIDAVGPHPGVVDSLSALAGRCRVDLVTRRPESVREPTVAWLDEHGVPYDALQCGVGSDRLGDADVLVDDQPAHVRRAGPSRGLLFLRPFNVDDRVVSAEDASTLGSGDPAALARDPARQWETIRAHVHGRLDR